MCFNALGRAGLIASVLAVVSTSGACAASDDDAEQWTLFDGNYPKCDWYRNEDGECMPGWPFAAWLSGHYSGLRVKELAQATAGVGDGNVADFHLGGGAYNWFVDVGVGAATLGDRRQTSTEAFECTQDYYEGVPIGGPVCDSQPKTIYSGVSGAGMSVEVGYAVPIPLWRDIAFVPGVSVGHSFYSVERKLGCQGCPAGEALDVDIDGWFVRPLARVAWKFVGLDFNPVIPFGSGDRLWGPSFALGIGYYGVGL